MGVWCLGVWSVELGRLQFENREADKLLRGSFGWSRDGIRVSGLGLRRSLASPFPSPWQAQDGQHNESRGEHVEDG